MADAEVKADDTPNRYFDPHTLEHIKRLDVRARLVVEGFLAGQHRSPYNGFAVEFASHREYAPGDEIKHIDWKVWSKTDRYYIKQYEEETNLKCTIVLDCSKSMRYGSQTEGWSKFDYAATSAACLAYLLQQQQDAVGLVTFNTKVCGNLPPSSHPSHLKLLMHELEQTKPDELTDVGDVFCGLAQQVRRRSMVVLFSDLFVDLPTLQRSLREFTLRKNEVVVFHVLHNDELTFPFEENTRFRGLEMDHQLHTDPRALRRSYLELIEKYVADVRKLCAASGIDYVLTNTKDSVGAVLASYLASRQRMRRLHVRR